MRSRHSGIWSAISAKASTIRGNCFSLTSRPAATISGLSSRDRGVNPIGSGLGTIAISGVTSPSCSRTQSAIAGVKTATTSARGAKMSSGSMPDVRSEVERCSWCTTTGFGGSSWIAAASSPGVTVTSTSTSSDGSTCSSPTSHSAVNWPSQRSGTSSDSRSCSLRARPGARSRPGTDGS